MLKIVHLQYSTITAGRAAIRLHNAMLEKNIDSSILSLEYDLTDSGKIEHLRLRSRIISWLDTSLQSIVTRNKYDNFGGYSYPFIGTDVSRLDQIREADIIYLHWVQGGFLSLVNIRKLARLKKPIIFIMHDMWTFTGGCHHSFTCEKYKSKCSDCQMFKKRGLIDWPAREFNKKRKLFSDFGNLYFVSPSKWLYNSAKHSLLIKDKPIFHIPNVLDSRLFKPLDMKIARQILNLEPDDTFIAFGAQNVNSSYKGWSELQKALQILSKDQNLRKIQVLIFGSAYNKQVVDRIPFKTRFMGFLKDEYSISLVYNAADLIITPSLADNLPTVVLESLSCGTPVVAFNVGGIPDMIEHKKNGYLAKYKDVEDLANGIRFCLENSITGQLLPDFNKSQIIKAHLELINSVQSDKN